MAASQYHILLEDGSYLLTEDGLAHILLEEAPSLADDHGAIEEEIPAGFYSLFDPDRYRPRRKREEEEQPKAKVIKIAKGEITTGIVSTPAIWSKQFKAATYDKVARSKSEAERAWRERIARIVRADDEWLMMN